jgi:hypothetical protein
MRKEMERVWFHVITHAVKEFRDTVQRGTEPLISEWWTVARNSSVIPFMEITQDALVANPTNDHTLLFAPPGVAVNPDRTVRPEDVPRCAKVRRVLSAKYTLDIDELVHPKREEAFRQKLEGGVVSLAHELEHTGLQYREDHDGTDSVCVATHPVLFVTLDGFLLSAFIYALGGAMAASALENEGGKE